MKALPVVVVLSCLSASLHCAIAQGAKSAFPDRPLRYVVPFPPGGSTDIVARIVAASLSEVLGKQVVIDNRGGAGGTVGAEIAARATPDGYTIFACNIASLAVSPALYSKLGYDPVAGFDPLGLIGSTPNSLVVHPGVPARTVAQFVSHAKAHPGKINYGSAGVGTSPQLSMELFKTTTGIDVVHVAYKGAGPAVVDLTGGHIQAMFATVPSVIGSMRAGKIHMLGVTSTTRFPDLPDVPTIAESGLPGFEVISWQGLCSPAGVSKPILSRLRSALVRALAAPETARQLADQSMVPKALSAEEFGSFIRAERVKWAKVVKDVGIVPK